MDFSKIIQTNYISAKSKDFVNSKYVVPVKDYDIDLKPFIENLNESLFEWIANPNINAKEFKILLAETLYTEHNFVRYVNSLETKENVRLVDILKNIFDHGIEEDKNTVRKIKILLNVLSKSQKPNLLSGNRVRYVKKGLFDI
jgi:hypothetical protein